MEKSVHSLVKTVFKSNRKKFSMIIVYNKYYELHIITKIYLLITRSKI